VDIACVTFRSDLGLVHEEIVGQHSCQLHVSNKLKDIERHRYWESQGYKVIRFWNHDVLNDMNGVIHEIEMALGK